MAGDGHGRSTATQSYRQGGAGLKRSRRAGTKSGQAEAPSRSNSIPYAGLRRERARRHRRQCHREGAALASPPARNGDRALVRRRYLPCQPESQPETRRFASVTVSALLEQLEDVREARRCNPLPFVRHIDDQPAVVPAFHTDVDAALVR